MDRSLQNKSWGSSFGSAEFTEPNSPANTRPSSRDVDERSRRGHFTRLARSDSPVRRAASKSPARATARRNNQRRSVAKLQYHGSATWAGPTAGSTLLCNSQPTGEAATTRINSLDMPIGSDASFWGTPHINQLEAEEQRMPLERAQIGSHAAPISPVGELNRRKAEK